MLSSTQQFIDALEAKGIKYEINEPTQSGKDVMTVTYSGDRMPTIRCLFFFDEDCESVAIRVFDILKDRRHLPHGQRPQQQVPLRQVLRPHRGQHRPGGDGRLLPGPRRG